MDSTYANENNRRLIVLVPECLDNVLTFANKVRWMAIRERRDVVYLALVNGEEDMMAASRCMTTIKAVTADQGLNIKVVLSNASDWLDTLKELVRPGDAILCAEEQVVKTRFFHIEPICTYLQTTLKIPVRTLSGFYHPVRSSVNRWVQKIRFWAGVFAILAGFLLVEINLDPRLHGAAGTALTFGIVFLEIGAIVAWSAISG